MTTRKTLRRCALGAGAVLMALAMPPAAAAPELDDFEFLQNSSVRVVTYYPGQVAFGTGWVATSADAARNANNAVIVTAAHTVRGATRITILEANSAVQLEANVRAIDNDRDIAFLEVRGLRNGGVALRVTPVVPPIGQEVRTTGYTAASDRPSRQEVAEISGVLLGAYSRNIPNPRPIWEHADVGVAQFQHSINLTPGFSGGPVIDKCGRVIGFNISNGGEIQLPGGSLDLAPGISFAVASAEIIKAAGDNQIRLNEDASPCPDAEPQARPDVPDPVPPVPDPPSYQRLLNFLQGRAGLALILGLLALVALGVAAWMFLGKPKGSRPAPQPAAKPEFGSNDGRRRRPGRGRALGADAAADRSRPRRRTDRPAADGGGAAVAGPDAGNRGPGANSGQPGQDAGVAAPCRAVL